MLETLDAAGKLIASRPLTLLALIIPIVAYTIRSRCLPKPIPGIPYNKESKRLLGDLPFILDHAKKTSGEFWSWFSLQINKHQSPICQAWPQPFSSKPWVILADLLEAQDILLRRTDEFDRSPLSGNMLRGVIPKGQITLLTTDEWRAHRGLMKDLLTPNFLNKVAAPSIYRRTQELVGLWRKKTELADGKPFSAGMDVHHCALDAIFSIAFGEEDGLRVIQTRKKHVEGLDKSDCPQQPDGSVAIPEGTLPAIAQDIVDLSESVEIALKSPAPNLAWKALAWVVPWWKQAWKRKEDLLRSSVEKSRDRIERKTTKEQDIRCALDNMVERELSMSDKTGRSPVFHSRDFYDELFGFILGGYDTTSTTTQWAVKYLAQQQHVQSKLRTVLQASLPEAAASKRQPTVDEIIRANDPYIDAVLEEMIRHSITLPGSARIAKRDTTVLGYPIPKGTEILLLSNGADGLTPGFSVPDEKRNESSKAAREEGRAHRAWDPSDIREFKPERWLTTDEKGRVFFDRMAGLHLTFGLGSRGCWGRRIAQLEFRIFICLFVWNFEFKALEGELADESYVDKLTRIPNKVFIKVDQCC